MALLKRKPTPGKEWNDLEQCLHLAADTGDDDKLLRSLARNVVYMTQPPTGAKPGSVEIFRMRRPMPLVPGVDGRTYVLTFTSFRALSAFHTDPAVTWTMVPAAILADELPSETPVLLSGEGRTAVVEPDDMRVVALLFARANVLQAISIGPATRVMVKRPKGDPPHCADPLRGVASRHPEVLKILWLHAQLDEPDGRAWWAFGVEFDDRADTQPFMKEAIASFDAACDQFATFHALGLERPRFGVAACLPGSGRIIYEA